MAVRHTAWRTWGMVAVMAGALLAAPASRAVAQDPTPVRIGLTYAPGTKPGVLVTPIVGPGADSIRAILLRDFDYGDRLTVIAADGEAAPNGALNYALYAKLGAAAVVQATITPTGALHVAVHDVAGARVMSVGDFPLPTPAFGADWRMTIHGAADEVERWITGQSGIAKTRIAFERGGQLWTVDSDGANPRAIPGTEGGLSPDWHPSGRYITYADLGADGSHIVVRDLGAGSNRRVSNRGGTNITPSFSPDGNTIVFASGDDGTDLYLVSPFESGAPHRISAGRGSLNASPSFSPDGRRIAFTSGRLGHPEVYITDADGTNADLLTTSGFGDQLYRSNPDWSPDGRKVAFQSQINGVFQVMTIGVSDRNVQGLTSEGRNEDPSWSPDSRHLVFTSTRSGTKQLWVLDTETYRTRQLTFGASARMAAWSSRFGAVK